MSMYYTRDSPFGVIDVGVTDVELHLYLQGYAEFHFSSLAPDLRPMLLCIATVTVYHSRSLQHRTSFMLVAYYVVQVGRTEA